MSRRNLASILFLSTIAGAGWAQPPAGPPAPAPELGQLWFLTAPGTWHCQGTSQPPGAPRHAVAADVGVRSDLDGFWRTARYAETRTAENPHPLTVQELYGYDAVRRAYVRIAFDSFGGWMSGSAPVERDRAVFEGQVAGTAPARLSFARTGDDAMTVKLEIGSPDGQTAVAADLTCRR